MNVHEAPPNAASPRPADLVLMIDAERVVAPGLDPYDPSSGQHEHPEVEMQVVRRDMSDTPYSCCDR